MEAIPYLPSPLMMPTPILCMQSKNTKMDNVNIVLDIRVFTSYSELKAMIMYCFRSSTHSTEANDQINPIVTYILAK